MSFQKISSTQFLFKSLAAFAGGIAGSIVIALVFILGSSLFKAVFNPENADGVISVNPIFIFAYLVMIFLGTATANILSTFLISLTDKNRYRRISSSIYQIFIANLVLFIITAPIYIITIGIDLKFIAYITSLHVIMGVFASSMILEILADIKYTLISLYSVILSILISTILIIIIFTISKNSVTLLFVGLPILWGSAGIALGAINLIYAFISNSYGVDFLNPEINYGNDDRTIREIEEEQKAKIEKEEKMQKMKETGADFLNKNV